MGLRDLAIVVCSENIRFKVILLSPAAQRTVRKSKQVQPHDFFKISAYWTQIKLESSSTWDKSCTGKITNFFFFNWKNIWFCFVQNSTISLLCNKLSDLGFAWTTTALKSVTPVMVKKRKKSIFQFIFHLYWNGFSSDIVSIKE